MFSPRGRLSLLRAVEDGKLDLTAGVEEHLYHCLDYRACNTVCPPGVRIGELIVHGRVAIEEKHPRPWPMKFMLQNVLISAERAEVISGPLRLIQALRLDRFGAWLFGGIPGPGKKMRELVEFAPRMGKPIRSELALVTPAKGEKGHRVAFFLGCMMNVAMPDTSRATVRLLCVMTMNWEFVENSLRRLASLPTFSSSSAASISSSMQKGDGFTM
jgi:glycolate oxidase iron-sulfur subunit